MCNTVSGPDPYSEAGAMDRRESSSDKDVEAWLAWVHAAGEVVRAWEAERGSQLTPRESSTLVERIARALLQAAENPRRRRWR